MSSNLFDCLVGKNKRRLVESKVLMMYVINCVPSISKIDRLNFSFNLFDSDDSRIISIAELKKILLANYFASSLGEVEKKAKLIVD